jgi:hypothetical protein
MKKKIKEIKKKDKLYNPIVMTNICIVMREGKKEENINEQKEN